MLELVFQLEFVLELKLVLGKLLLGFHLILELILGLELVLELVLEFVAQIVVFPAARKNMRGPRAVQMALYACAACYLVQILIAELVAGLLTKLLIFGGRFVRTHFFAHVPPSS